jgi:hypothetical protein
LRVQYDDSHSRQLWHIINRSASNHTHYFAMYSIDFSFSFICGHLDGAIELCAVAYTYYGRLCILAIQEQRRFLVVLAVYVYNTYRLYSTREVSRSFHMKDNFSTRIENIATMSHLSSVSSATVGSSSIGSSETVGSALHNWEAFTRTSHSSCFGLLLL